MNHKIKSVYGIYLKSKDIADILFDFKINSSILYLNAKCK